MKPDSRVFPDEPVTPEQIREAVGRVICVKKGHVRNPEGLCVKCHDQAPEPGYEST